MVCEGQEREGFWDCSCPVDNVCHKKDLYIDSFKSVSTLPVSMVPDGPVQNVYKSMEMLPQALR